MCPIKFKRVKTFLKIPLTFLPNNILESVKFGKGMTGFICKFMWEVQISLKNLSVRR